MLKIAVRSIVTAIRGTAEMIGLFVCFIFLVGRTINGEWALGNIINGSVDKNGVALTIVLFVSMIILGGIYKSECDKGLDQINTK